MLASAQASPAHRSQGLGTWTGSALCSEGQRAPHQRHLKGHVGRRRRRRTGRPLRNHPVATLFAATHCGRSHVLGPHALARVIDRRPTLLLPLPPIVHHVRLPSPIALSARSTSSAKQDHVIPTSRCQCGCSNRDRCASKGGIPTCAVSLDLRRPCCLRKPQGAEMTACGAPARQILTTLV